MSETHTVQEGEYLELIAKQAGFRGYEVIYNDAHNGSFKTARPNPNILYPGDKVYIPDLDPGHDAAATDKKHKYVIKTPMVTLDVYLRRNGVPLKNRDYTLKFKDLDGKDQKLPGTTGADGHLLQKEKIPVGVAEVKLTLANLPSYTRILKLGFLHPITFASGVQMRLNNLGFACGPANGAQSPAYTAALRAFQQKHLPQNVTGKADNDTLDALRNEYDKGIKS
jgi:N-acetylmuramoyl-L-alanine amidase